MNKINPDMLRLGRQLRRMSQAELASALNVSPAVISRSESGIRPFQSELIGELSKVLEQDIEFFFYPGEIHAASMIFHRRRASTLMREVEYTNAKVNLRRIQVERLLKKTRVRTPRRMFRFDRAGGSSAAEAARQLRAVWQLPVGPIDDLCRILDSAGIFIVFEEDLAEKVDGVSLWPLGQDDGFPIIVLRDGQPPDRERFVLAHELGHLALHHMPSDDFEKDANEFAAEFLMPASDIADDLKDMTLPKAAALKRHWKVSMQALIMRAAHLNAISAAKYKRLMMELSEKGYRKTEPVLLKPENPMLLESLQEYVNSSVSSQPKLRVHMDAEPKSV